MGPALGMAYSELLPYATPGFVAFGAGSLLTGWLGDRWSRRHMMVIFFIGIGAAMIAVGFVQTPLQLGAALLLIGIFASIYHPVGTAMIVSYADSLGREMGLNGVWGNLGVASSALVTGVIGQYLGWRYAFIIPGIVTVLVGIAFAMLVVHEDRKSSKQAAAQARVAKQDMWRVVVSLLIVVIAISTTFNAVTVALPKLFAERLADFGQGGIRSARGQSDNRHHLRTDLSRNRRCYTSRIKGYPVAGDIVIDLCLEEPVQHCHAAAYGQSRATD